MANHTLYFFLAPTWDLPSPSGPVQLGNVITSLKAPERPLYRGPKLDSESFSSSQTRVTFSIEKLRAGRFGIFTKFMALLLGFGVDATIGWESNDTYRFTFETLEKAQFYLDSSYLQACIAAEPVRRYLSKSRYRKPIYIITGLKTVSGAKAESLKTSNVESSVSPRVDAAVWVGVPVEGGIDIGVKAGNRGAVTWEAAGDFVFAFRVQKIMVEKRTEVVSREDYKKGAMLDAAIEERSDRELDIIEKEMDGQVEGFLKEKLTDDDGCQGIM
ncbi:hypothetical protein GQX73_g288 [Xylaria multiplex]|uniref:Uncharacterized protein n=1 Tax=Xylaria multiplex TaxID=323545 RepID=A0A7C8IVD9_9PEZI|nr:hypothetical protein GQX73_g288 [Xylaria multiplex]